MCTVKAQDSNNGVIQVRVAHHVKSVSVSRQFRTMKAEPLGARVAEPEL